MLEITIPEIENYDEEKNEFFMTKECTLRLEHSLVSISKWESKWHKPFLVSDEKTIEELTDYIRCMTITQNVDPNVYFGIPDSEFKKVEEYIQDPMTATTFKEQKSQANREIVTSELIYYWMVALEIPFECQKWHLNRLLTLIKVCNIKNQPQKKMPIREILNNNRALNAARRKKFHTKG